MGDTLLTVVFINKKNVVDVNLNDNYQTLLVIIGR